MRVGQNDRRGVLLQGLLHDIARVDRCSVDRALDHLLVADNPLSARAVIAMRRMRTGRRAKFPDLIGAGRTIVRAPST